MTHYIFKLPVKVLNLVDVAFCISAVNLLIGRIQLFYCLLHVLHDRDGICRRGPYMFVHLRLFFFLFFAFFFRFHPLHDLFFYCFHLIHQFEYRHS